ncbi:MAG: DNA primase [Muribaculaceae bacterium]|nr:DNA primase [Muribaculaceae bacterium]
MIDHNTVQQILDTADIVDVVSDFVALKRRGANWIGLCPFHNDRRPSFYVSRAKGICKCFACGEGGSAVNFIMKHEQLSYPEALRYLARKYHIEIQEKELTDEEKQAQTEREAMLMLNEWACAYFEKQLHETQAGQEIGLSYFRERGFNDATIKEFRLGYSSEGYDDFYKAAVAQGFNPKLLFDTGLCIADDRGGGRDRFRGRVMFPITNIAGKVIAFGGRTLKKDKNIAKYVNSPESAIYSKRNVIYGLSLAKREISKQDKCYIVEGYADVISMHQAGFKNVIASSGTALTEGHIHAIRRFTSNVTEMFDGDAAGIKAAIRGVDMLLKEGISIKVLPLPPEDDPDTFVRAHSHSEVEEYIAQNEADFINFKSSIVLKDAQNDPIKRTAAITDVVKSIALIPDEIARMVYAKECSTLFGFDEQTILRQIKQYRGKYLEQWRKERTQQQEREQRLANQQSGPAPAPAIDETAPAPLPDEFPPDFEPIESMPKSPQPAPRSTKAVNSVLVQEREVIRLIVNYGMCYLTDTEYNDGTVRPSTVLEHINNEIGLDQMSFSDPLYRHTFEIALQYIAPYYQDLAKFQAEQEVLTQQFIDKEMAEQDNAEPEAYDSATLIDAQERKEKEIQARANVIAKNALDDFSSSYLMKVLCSIDEDDVRQLACELATDNMPQLSKIHTQYAVILEERDKLLSIVPDRLYNWKNALLVQKIDETKSRIAHASAEELPQLMEHLQQLYSVRHQLAAIIGDRVVNPN